MSSTLIPSSGTRPSRMLSDDEALDLLLREGYPTAEHPLPEDLWELCKRRRPEACQPTVAEIPQPIAAFPPPDGPVAVLNQMAIGASTDAGEVYGTDRA